MGNDAEQAGWLELRTRNPWPDEPPRDKQDWHGFLDGSTVRMLEETIAAGPCELIVELGSWCGRSARWFMQHTEARLVCIDHWEGNPGYPGAPELKSRLPHVRDQFLTNLWPWRERVTAVCMPSVAGLWEVAFCGLVPDMVYVDAGHDFASVTSDLRTVAGLFPSTRLVGDDWQRPEVRRGVSWFAEPRVLNVVHTTQGWRLS